MGETSNDDRVNFSLYILRVMSSQAFPEEALRVATYSAVSTESWTALHGRFVGPKYGRICKLLLTGIHKHINTFVYMHVYKYIYIYICMHVCTYVRCMYVCM